MQLLGSFIGARNQYALVRLEYAMQHDQSAAPPPVDRLPDASERTLREDWPDIERQLDSAMAYAKRLENGRGNQTANRQASRWLLRSVREMDQYARAIRWVMTVTESEESP